MDWKQPYYGYVEISTLNYAWLVGVPRPVKPINIFVLIWFLHILILRYNHIIFKRQS